MEKNYPILTDVNVETTVPEVVLIRNAATSRDYRDYIRLAWKNNFAALGVPVIFLAGTANNRKYSKRSGVHDVSSGNKILLMTYIF